MKRINIGISDPGVLAVVRAKAELDGVSEGEIVVRALRFWLVEKEINEEEADETKASGKEICENNAETL